MNWVTRFKFENPDRLFESTGIGTPDQRRAFVATAEAEISRLQSVEPHHRDVNRQRAETISEHARGLTAALSSPQAEDLAGLSPEEMAQARNLIEKIDKASQDAVEAMQQGGRPARREALTVQVLARRYEETFNLKASVSPGGYFARIMESINDQAPVNIPAPRPHHFK